MTNRIPGRVALLAAVSLLSACAILSTPDPVEVYLLPSSVRPASATAVEALPWSLRVKRPESGAQLVGRRIVVLPSDNVLSVYKGASWADPAPVMLRDRVIDAFRADGRISAVSSDDRGLHADFELDSDLRAFQSEYRDGAPEVVVRVDARLVRTSTQRILASRRFGVKVPASGVAIPEVVRAFGQAADKVSDELVQWVVEQGVAAEPSIPVRQTNPSPR